MSVGERLADFLNRRGVAVTLEHTEPGAGGGTEESIQTRGLFGREFIRIVAGPGGTTVTVAEGLQSLILAPALVRNSAGVLRRPRVGDKVVRAHYSGSPPAGVKELAVLSAEPFEIDDEDQVHVLGLEG